MGKSQRINGFDALRTVAMWLGVVLHSIIAYKFTREAGWPADPLFASRFYDWLYDIIHVFRMPLFFLVAGFFARLVVVRSGIRYFLEQRFKRIFIPFVLGVLLIVPPTMLPFNFYRLRELQQLPSAEAWHWAIRRMVSWNGIAHLWFLYYLVLFYLAAMLLYFIGRRPGKLLPVVRFRGIGRISPLLLLAVALVLFVLLWVFGAPVPPVYTGLKPGLFAFLYYGLFFGCGWVVQVDMSCVKSLQRGAIWVFSLGVLLSLVRWIMGPGMPVRSDLLLAAVETIALTAGLTGLFLKYFHEENRLWRYCSDAAYWVYLVHMGIVAGLQVYLLHSVVSPWLRCPLILLVTFTISLLSYEYFVRYTVVGEYLHGRRFRRGKNPEIPTK